MSTFSAIGVNIGTVRFALGVLALAGTLLGMWFSVLFQPLIYGAVVALVSLWIGLWPFKMPNLGLRLLTACVGSVGVCIVLLVVGEVIAYIRHDGQEEFGPVLFVPAFMMVMGVPITGLAAVVAAFAPRLSS